MSPWLCYVWNIERNPNGNLNVTLDLNYDAEIVLTGCLRLLYANTFRSSKLSLLKVSQLNFSPRCTPR